MSTFPITTPADVLAFARHLIFDLDVNFHPDTNFTEYIEDGAPVFSDEQTEALNDSLRQAHLVCESASVDIYELTSPLLWERMGVHLVAE